MNIFGQKLYQIKYISYEFIIKMRRPIFFEYLRTEELQLTSVYRIIFWISMNYVQIVWENKFQEEPSIIVALIWNAEKSVVS